MNQHLAALPVARPTRVRYAVLGWVCTLSMLTYIDRVAIKSVRDDMNSELGLTNEQFKYIFAAFGLAYALFEVPSGWLGDRLGPRKVLARIVLAWSVFTALTGLVWNIPALDTGLRITLPFSGVEAVLFDAFVLLVLVRFLFGMGEAGAYPNIARAMKSWFPYRQRGLGQGLLWTFGRWGGAVSPVLVVIISQLVGWRGTFAVFGVLGLVWVVGFFLWFRDSPRDHPRVNAAELALIEQGSGAVGKLPPLSWGSLAASPTLWLLCLMYLCSNAGWAFFITWDVAYFQKSLHLSGLSLTLASGAPLFFGGVACFCGGFLTDRQVRVWGRRWGRTLQGMAAYLVGGLAFLLAFLLTQLLAGGFSAGWLVGLVTFLAVTALCLGSFAKDFAMAVSWSTCIDIGHRYSGTVSGFMNMVGNLGTPLTSLAVPWLAGLWGAGDRANWSAALIYSASMFLIASGCWLFINPRRVIVYSPDDRARLQMEGALE
jgi:MFS family permease